jgi:hypothetical protein
MIIENFLMNKNPYKYKKNEWEAKKYDNWSC